MNTMEPKIVDRVISVKGYFDGMNGITRVLLLYTDMTYEYIFQYDHSYRYNDSYKSKINVLNFKGRTRDEVIAKLSIQRAVGLIKGKFLIDC